MSDGIVSDRWPLPVGADTAAVQTLLETAHLSLRRRLSAAAIALSGLLAAGVAQATSVFYLVHAEELPTVTLDGRPVDPATAGARLLNAGRGRLYLEAYGRAFDSEVSTNDSLTRGLNAHGASALQAGRRFLKGRVLDMPGSWVRLTVHGGGLAGAIWDGRDLYVIESTKNASSDSVVPLRDRHGTVVYRASDALLRNGAITCMTTGAPQQQTLNDAAKSLVRELAGLHKPGASRDIDVALAADVEYAGLHRSETETAMLERLNIADGIFSTQLALQLTVSEVDVFRNDPDPFGAVGDAPLLDELTAFASSRPSLQSAAVTYLFTGRDICTDDVFGCDLDGASSAELCGPAAVAFGEHLGSMFPEALLLAHELGHNMGSGHDGMGAVTLMSPTSSLRSEIIGSYSKEQMSARLSTASCVRKLAGVVTPPPVETPPPAPPQTISPPEVHRSGGGGTSGFEGLLVVLAALGRRRASRFPAGRLSTVT